MRGSTNTVVSVLAAVALVAAIAAFAWSVFGVSVQIGLAGQIDSARAKWSASSGGNYRAIVRVIDYNRPTVESITVVVKDGHAVSALARPALLAPDPSDPGVPIPPGEMATYTIEGLFDFASTQVADLPGMVVTAGNGYRYTLRINSQWGYIEEFKMDVCGRGPLSAQVSECRWGFDVLDVQIGG